MSEAFYQSSYTDQSDRFEDWRTNSAREKADHIASLIDGEPAPSSVVDIGCGDGAVLEELSHRGIGKCLVGYEIARSPIDLVRSRDIPRLERADVFDGEHLPELDAAFDLGVLSHVLEHTERPEVLLREVARIARSVVIEVPLENVLASRRTAYRQNAEAIGHIQQFDRDAVHRLAVQAGLRVKRGFFIHQSLDDRMFWADTPQLKAKAFAGWAARQVLDRIAAPLSRRLLVSDYACLCEPQITAAPDGS